MTGYVSVNSDISNLEEGKIPVLDRGFLFGDNVFEVLVAFQGQVLDAGRHLQRLRKSAEILDLSIPWSDEELKFEFEHLVSLCSAPKVYLRLVITRGNGLGLLADQKIEPNKVIMCLPAPIQNPSLYEEGIRLQRGALPYTERQANPKTGNYLRSILAMNKAKDAGFDDVLWCNSQNEITEASTANVFFIGRHGDEVEIVTPPTMSGILEGITRETLIDILAQATIPVHQQTVFSDELPRFDEAFLCSTVKGLIPVQKINDQKLFTTRRNSVFRHIQRLFMAWVEGQVGVGVDWNTGEKKARDEHGHS